MKNIKFKIVALFASLAVLLSSCDAYFEYEYPASDLPEWQTVADVEYMVVSCYELLFSQGSWANNVIASYSNHTEAMSDLTLVIPQVDQSNYPANNRENYPFDAGGKAPEPILGSIYQCIRSANTVIDWANLVNAGEVEILSVLSDSDQAYLDRMNGEALFMRAYGHWMAAQVFMAPYSEENLDTYYIPLITESVFSAEEILAPNMGTMSDVYEAMIEDCETAITLFEHANMSDTDIQVTRRGFANQYAAAGLLMRVRFAMGDWAGALEMVDYIKACGIYDLSEQPIRAFNRDPSLPANYHYAKEVIFEAAYAGSGALADEPWGIARIAKIGHANSSQVKNSDVADAQTNPNWAESGRGVNWCHKTLGGIIWNPQIVKQIGWTDEIESDQLSFELNDAAKADLRCTQLHYHLQPYLKGGDATVNEGTWATTTWKALWNDKYLRSPSISSTQIPLIRYAEVILTEATCAFQSGDTARALTALNAVAERACAYTWDDDASTVFEPYTSITEKDIEYERIKELGMELNDRLVYLSALKLPMYSSGKVKTNSDGATFAVNEEVAQIEYPYNGFHLRLAAEEYDYSSTSGLLGY